MKVVEFIIAHWSDIFLVIAAIASVIFAIYKKDYNIVKKQIFSLVTEAESAYGSGTGILKLSTVIAVLYPKLPVLFKTFITEKQLVKIIESVLAEAKKTWAENPELTKFIETESEDAENE